MGSSKVERVPSVKVGKGQLTEREQFICDDVTFMCFTGMTIQEIADKYHTTVMSLHRLRTKAAFVEELNKRSEQLHKSYLHEVNNMLRELIVSPDEKIKLKAIELYYKQTGQLKVHEVIEQHIVTEMNVDDILEDLAKSMPVDTVKCDESDEAVEVLDVEFTVTNDNNNNNNNNNEEEE